MIDATSLKECAEVAVKKQSIELQQETELFIKAIIEPEVTQRAQNGNFSFEFTADKSTYKAIVALTYEFDDKTYYFDYDYFKEYLNHYNFAISCYNWGFCATIKISWTLEGKKNVRRRS